MNNIIFKTQNTDEDDYDDDREGQDIEGYVIEQLKKTIRSDQNKGPEKLREQDNQGTVKQPKD